jgi:hypothetical protein
MAGRLPLPSGLPTAIEFTYSTLTVVRNKVNKRGVVSYFAGTPSGSPEPTPLILEIKMSVIASTTLEKSTYMAGMLPLPSGFPTATELICPTLRTMRIQKKEIGA